jgi:DMSO/TMAO reductase YedYZ molybdopterin-dependent catalytic subunit
VHRKVRVYNLIFFAAILARPLPTVPEARGQTAAPPAELRISGDIATPLVLTVADLKKMPRKTLSVVNPHEKKTEAYEGVLLEELLQRAGVPTVSNFEVTRWPVM